jgi:hypothetical protein
MTVCDQCGYNASPEARYCIMCGTRLNFHSETDNGLMSNIKNLIRGNTAEDELNENIFPFFYTRRYPD